MELIINLITPFINSCFLLFSYFQFHSDFLCFDLIGFLDPGIDDFNLSMVDYCRYYYMGVSEGRWVLDFGRASGIGSNGIVLVFITVVWSWLVLGLFSASGSWVFSFT